MKLLKFNIHDLNFILTFAGFAIFTSITDTLSSVVYRAFALIVAVLCIHVSGYRFRHLPMVLKLFLGLMVIVDLKTGFHLISETTAYTDSRNLALLFIFGVTLVPVLAFAAGYCKIHWQRCLVVLEVLLVFTILMGYTSSLSIDDSVRMSLNARQSTLAFGDNSGYLFLLSICLLNYSQSIVRRQWLWVWKIFLILALILSVLGMARAGSRGPVISALMGGLFILVTLRLKKQFNVSLIIIAFVAVFGITTATLERFAPVLYSRMSSTIDEGDMSGRDVLFAQAIQKISDNPISGDNPVIVLSDGFTSCHNGYLDVGVCLGIFGFIFYVSLSIWILISLITHRSRIQTMPQLFLSAMFFLSATRAMTGANFVSNPNYALCIACACVVVSQLKNEQSRQRIAIAQKVYQVKA